MSVEYMNQLLEGRSANHIFPFLWMREQTEETLRTEIEKIYECGIRAVCLESRPHPDFIGEGWWHDFDIVIDEAKKRGMKIWILDDAHFPTGQANGLIPSKYPERARKYMMMQYTDCVGPVVSANLDVNLLTTKQFTWLDFGKKIDKPIIDKAEIVSVTAVKLIEDDIVGNEVIDITENVSDGWLTWDVPEGTWRICVTFITYDFGANNDYINYIDRESVSTLLEAVYETHYEHYADEFGKTIAGFFSDEPGFYNVAGYQMRNAIGRKHMALPWCAEMQGIYEDNRPDWKKQLIYLWLNCPDETIPVEQRRFYMDQVSMLYSKNFSCQLGKWCEDHGVAYVGHVIEDYEEHTHLGGGAGHFYRAIKGQAYAGIDDIGGQIIPGNPVGTRRGVTDILDGRFYHFGLAKMGASAAQIDPAKKGRLLCEMFGAYGWNFGVKSMKWLVDFLLLQGVNEMVPHAFSMADYPDVDCPPHFYARGNNGQFPYFAQLMKYSNRLCDLLSNGVNVPQVAVMYPAESDWMNESMKLQTPGRVLLENQIDYEVIPTDVFEDRKYYGVSLEKQVLTVNSRKLYAVIIPETKFVDEKMYNAAIEMAQAGIPVYYVDSKPEYVIGDGVRHELTDMGKCQVIELDKIAETLRSQGIYDISVSAPASDLLYYHYKKEAQDIYGLFNTSVSAIVSRSIALPVEGMVVVYDAMENVMKSIPQKLVDGYVVIDVELRPYESIIVIAGLDMVEDELEPVNAGRNGEADVVVDISNDWNVTAVRTIEYPNFPAGEQVSILEAYSRKHPEFAGIMRYEKTVNAEDSARLVQAADRGELVFFEPQHVYECAEVWVNGKSAGKRVAPPYSWEISKLLGDGCNQITVEVSNTPTRDTLKAFSPFGPEREIIEPSGMFGKVFITSVVD